MLNNNYRLDILISNTYHTFVRATGISPDCRRIVIAKAERIELQLNGEVIDCIDTWMSEKGKAGSRSDAVRELIYIGLGAATGKNIYLSDGDKLNFMMLREIMKSLKIKDPEVDVEFVAETIYGGHFWAPTWEMQGLFHNHTDRPEEVTLVVNALEMWDFIEGCVENCTPEEIERIKAAHHGYLPQFQGFDGNEEGALMSIARFMVEKMGRFSRFKKRDFNAHTMTALRYHRMTKAFEPIRATLGFGRRLNVDQIIEVLKAKSGD